MNKCASRTFNQFDCSHLQSFLSDDDPTAGSETYDKESSWVDTEQLTHRDDSEPKELHSFVMRNSAFEDVAPEDDCHGNELAELNWQRPKGKKGRTTSPL